MIENIKIIRKIIVYLENKENLTDNEFAILYMYSKMILNITEEEIENHAN